ncbi:hypothetical protein [Cellulophaga baltica]|uniref:Lipoprotein n=1 Tax=Cellulophaga baltica TaxID=76594 RepID=A0A1G7M827_9FLAO|nr:hypothetical protein [Cellulophaga baltica]SDF57958.1 hypothetical protein SAMN04487992_1352 [Cellulophaga baltica]
MKVSIFLTILSFLIISCNQNIRQKAPTVTDIKIDTTKTNKIMNSVNRQITCDNNLDSDFTSQILCKIENLERLKSNYVLIKQGVILVNDSKIYKGIKKLKKITEKSKIKDKIDNLYYLSEMIFEIQFCFLKGTTDMGGKTYPRARIEEVIFKSENCASQFIQNLNESLENNNSLKDLFDKSPNSIFRENNRVYYISSGGFYMMEIYKNLESAIKNKACVQHGL